MQPYSLETRDQRATQQRIRRWVMIVCIVLVAGFVVTFIMKAVRAYHVASEAKVAAAAAPLVDVINVEQAPVTIALKLPGETAAWYESVIYARVDGYVAKWTANIGDSVKKDQVLATIETPELDAQLVAAQAKTKSAQALVKAREAEEEFAKTTYIRWKDSPKGVVSEQEREAKKAAYTSAVAAYEEAQAQVALDEADMGRYTVLTKFKQVLAPFDGKIIERKIDVGNLVTAGSGANTTPLYKIAQNNPMRIFVDVPQNAATEMKPGIGANITMGDGQVIQGKIARTANAINQQARTLKVEIDIANPKATLVSGMYVDVAFDIPTHGLLQLPAAAILFRTRGPEVAIVGADSVIHYSPVSIARDDGNIVELKSGVNSGDQVVLNINNQIVDGAKVVINQPKDEHAAATAQ